MKVEKGNKVKVEYKGTLDDGSVFDSSETHGKPLEFKAGEGRVIPGFDKAVLGMEKGESKKVNIKSADAYGSPNPMLVKKVPKEQLPAGKEIKPGMLLAVGLPNGQQLPAKITAVDDKEVTIDLNHPLAGKDLTFEIKVVDISEAGDDEEESCECCSHDEECGCEEEPKEE